MGEVYRATSTTMKVESYEHAVCYAAQPGRHTVSAAAAAASLALAEEWPN